MADKTTRGVAAWIKRQLASNRKAGACTVLQLFHVTSSAKLGSSVVRLDVAEVMGGTEHDKDAIDGFAATFAEDIIEAATDYAEGMGDTQRFAVAAYFGADEERAARTAFRITVESEEVSGELESEGANMSGIVRQLMRHNESLMKMALASMGANMNTLQRSNDRQADMLEKLWEDKVNNIETVESLLSNKHQRELETMQEQAKIRTREKFTTDVAALLPAVANKLVGAKILPETADPVLQMVLRLSESLTPAEFEAMIKTLPPEKQIVLIELMQAAQKKTGGAPDEPGNGN